MKDSAFRIRELIREAVIVRNPALVEAAGLFPLIAAAVSLKASVLICAASFTLVVLTGLTASLLLKRVPRFARIAIYFALNTAVLYALRLLFIGIAPNETASLGIVLPLLASSSFVALHCERYSVKQSPRDCLVSCLFSACGYCAVCIVAGAARELLGNGTLWGHEFKFIVTASGMLLPFGGLLALGFLAAVFKFLRIKLYPHYADDKISDIITTSEASRKEEEQ